MSPKAKANAKKLLFLGITMGFKSVFWPAGGIGFAAESMNPREDFAMAGLDALAGKRKRKAVKLD